MWKNIKILIKILGVILIIIGISNIVSFIVSRAYHHTNWSAFALAVLYIVSGIGILFLKLWAKWVVIMCSVYRIVQTPIQTIAWVYSTGGWDKVEVGSTIFTILITVVINLFVIYFVTRPRVKELFK